MFDTSRRFDLEIVIGELWIAPGRFLQITTLGYEPCNAQAIRIQDVNAKSCRTIIQAC